MMEEREDVRSPAAADGTGPPAAAAATSGTSFFLDPRFVRRMAHAFSPRFVAYIGFGMHLIKGVLAGGGMSGMLLTQRSIYVLKGVSARDKQIFMAATHTPWAIKPVLGLINDIVPLLGWEKGFYMVMAACVGTLSWSAIATLGDALAPEMICVLFILIVLQVAWTDLMVEGLYTVRMKLTPQYGADLVTYVWSGITFCGAIGVIAAGPAIDLVGPYAVAYIAMPCAAAIVVPTLLGWSGEARLPVERRGLQRAKLREQSDVILTAAVLGCSCVVIAVTALLGVADGPHFALVLLCLVGIFVTIWKKLDYGLAVVCIYMASAQVSLKRLLDESPWLQYTSECQRF
jgi:hypothetical protein